MTDRSQLFAPPLQLEEDIITRPTLFRRSLNRRKKTGQTVRSAKLFEKPKENPSAWVIFSWAITCCFPSSVLSKCGIQPISQQAWREKFTLCFISFTLMVLTLFFLLFFSNLVCPQTLTENTIPVNVFGGIVIFGKMYKSETLIPPFNTLFEQTDAAFGGIDVSQAFKRDSIPACQDPQVAKFKFAQLQSSCEPDSCLDLNELITQKGLKEYDSILGFQNKTVKLTPVPAYEWKDVRQRKLVAYQNSVLNFVPYFLENPQAIEGDKVDEFMRLAQQINDATHLMESNGLIKDKIKECLIQKYTAGILSVLPMSCIMTRLLTWVIAGTILSIIMAKFVMALIFSWFGSAKLSKDPITSAIANHYARANASKPLLYDDYEAKRLGPSPVRDGRQRGVAFLKTQPGANIPKPHPADLYTVLLVTCYSEGESSIRGTLDSLSATDYDDSKKLLFVIADGLVKGSENPVSTPEILISMMDHDPRFGTDPTPQSYVAVASGSKQHNMAQVYCGSYNYQGRAVPMVLVVKCGTEAEKSTAKPGNRGKRDSQLILMNFFSRVTMNDRMTPLDFDMFRKIHHITGVTPDFYEGVLMVDADTYVDSKCLRYLVNAVQNDHSIMGLCGETRIANKRQSWVTRIQVFEYFISHQMGKAFESIFGGVTCLPGCFSMWRIKTINTDGMVLPILGNPDILEQYSTNEVFTLHQKNLLLLGEDRFLTTIMLRQFPNRKTVFVPQAFCKTVVPDDFKTLLSQRRRWINSTIHNLMELVLVSNLCGTFCFSMQFIVFMDLLSTAVMPAGLLATYYLIFTAIFKVQYSTDNITSIVLTATMGIIIFLPAFLVLLTGKRYSYVGWMFIYLAALPIWQFILPLYAMWNFDDFSWGETRKVSGEAVSKSGHGDDEDGKFATHQVPFRRWDEYEREWRHALMMPARGSHQTMFNN